MSPHTPLFLASRSSAGGFQSLFGASTPTLPPTPNNQCYFMVFQALLWYACIKKKKLTGGWRYWVKLLCNMLSYNPDNSYYLYVINFFSEQEYSIFYKYKKKKKKSVTMKQHECIIAVIFAPLVAIMAWGWYKTAAPTPVCAFRASVINGASLPGPRPFGPTGMSARCFTTHCFRLHLLTTFVSVRATAEAQLRLPLCLDVFHMVNCLPLCTTVETVWRLMLMRS